MQESPHWDQHEDHFTEDNLMASVREGHTMIEIWPVPAKFRSVCTGPKTVAYEQFII